jgi:hypothetical protein
MVVVLREVVGEDRGEFRIWGEGTWSYDDPDDFCLSLA